MSKLIILEGSRGTGKSSVAHKLRQTTKHSTLINCTGFHNDGEEGLEKISKYYKELSKFFMKMQQHDSTFILDRFFFSEMVYSRLYKEYDFSNIFYSLVNDLPLMAKEIHIFYFTIHNEEELKDRLIRDKVPFGKAKESVTETLKQQRDYDSMFAHIQHHVKNIQNVHFHEVETSYSNTDQLRNHVSLTGDL